MKSVISFFLLLCVTVYSQDILKNSYTVKLEMDSTQSFKKIFNDENGKIYSSIINIPELYFDYTFLVNNISQNKNEFKLIVENKADNFDNISILKNGKIILTKTFEQNNYEITLITEFENLDSIKYKYRFHFIEPLNLNIKILVTGKVDVTYINKNYLETTYTNIIETKSYDKIQLSGYNISIGAKLLFNNKHGFELRLAQALYETPFQGSQIAVNYNYYFTDKFFSYLGLIGHWGLESAHGTYNYSQGESGFMYGFGVGYNLISKFNLVFSAYEFDINSFSSIHSDGIGYSKIKRKKWNNLFNIGIEFTF